jgi:ubiquinone/menaquinone biosynthesis C-methylase UbiE
LARGQYRSGVVMAALPAELAADYPSNQALAAYEALAHHYDTYSSGNNYLQWANILVQLATEYGWSGRRILDVGAGTGAIAEHLSREGFTVTAVDLSPAMIQEAQRRRSGDIEFLVADVAELDLGRTFDLVISTDDVLNYLVDGEVLRRALERMRAHLVPGGQLIFDINTALVYRTSFACCEIDASRDCVLVRHGYGSADFPAGGICDIDLTILDPDPTAESGWTSRTTRHTQRHYPIDDMTQRLRAAGFTVAGVRGPNNATGRFDHGVDESTHFKAMFIAVAEANGAVGREG